MQGGYMNASRVFRNASGTLVVDRIPVSPFLGSWFGDSMRVPFALSPTTNSWFRWCVIRRMECGGHVALAQLYFALCIAGSAYLRLARLAGRPLAPADRRR